MAYSYILYVAHITLCRTLTANIRTRRGSKVAINLPLFIDEKTLRPFIDPAIPWDRNLYPEDPGSYHVTPLTRIPLLTAADTRRGEKWRCLTRPYLHGCYGLWNGLLLFTIDVPIVQRSRCTTDVRCPCPGRAYYGELPSYIFMSPSNDMRFAWTWAPKSVTLLFYSSP